MNQSPSPEKHTLKASAPELEQALFGKRVLIPLKSEEEIKILLTPLWEKEEYVREQNPQAKTLHSLCVNSYKHRTTTHTEAFVKAFSFLDVYKLLRKAVRDPKTLLDTTRRFGIEYYPRKSLIFSYGSPGDKYYIVLAGKIEIWIPVLNENKTVV